MKTLIELFIITACLVKIDGERLHLDENTIVELPADEADAVRDANRGRVPTPADRKRVAEAEAAAKAAAKKAADEAKKASNPPAAP